MNMNHQSIFLKLTLILAMLAIVGCASTPKVERTGADTTVDISGRWNDSDSRMVAEAMIQDCLNGNWLNNFTRTNRGKQPDVIVGSVVNRSHEHINVQTFVKDLERALINSGRVSFVASKTEREEIRDERADMAMHSTDESMKGPGQEAGADFMLKGTLNTIVDEAGGKKVVFYQTNLELVDMNTNRKAWIGEKKIKKIVSRSKVGW